MIANPKRIWLLAGALGGVVLTLICVAIGEQLAGRGLAVGPEPAPAPTSSWSWEPPAPAGETVRERFADLYLDYLLEDYYTPARGYCRALLERACEALLSAKLLPYASKCRGVPHADFVLAVGRFQEGTGLPVDGKAGPATMRKLIGGSFTSRREMAATHCVTGSLQADVTAAASSGSSTP